MVTGPKGAVRELQLALQSIGFRVQLIVKCRHADRHGLSIFHHPAKENWLRILNKVSWSNPRLTF